MARAKAVKDKEKGHSARERGGEEGRGHRKIGKREREEGRGRRKDGANAGKSKVREATSFLEEEAGQGRSRVEAPLSPENEEGAAPSASGRNGGENLRAHSVPHAPGLDVFFHPTLTLSFSSLQKENEAHLLGLMPEVLWCKVLESLGEDYDYSYFPIAMSCRFFRDKRKELAERNPWMDLTTFFSAVPPNNLCMPSSSEQEEAYDPKHFSEAYIKWCYDVKPTLWETKLDLTRRRERLMCYCAQLGYLDLLKSMRRDGCAFDVQISEWAARGGQIEVLHFLKSEGHILEAPDCSAAAEWGQLDTLKELRRMGCPWDENTCTYAANGGHLEVLKWLRSQNPPCPWSEKSSEFAVLGGHLDILIWMKQKGCPWHAKNCSFASLNGHLHCIKWMLENGCDGMSLSVPTQRRGVICTS